MEFKGETEVFCTKDQPQRWVEYLYRFYYPLTSQDACTLYCLLYSFLNQKANMEEIVKVSRLAKSRFEKAKRELEEFYLLDSYYDAIHTSWKLKLMPVLEPEDFLANDTYARLFLNVCGSVAFEQLKKQYVKEDPQVPYTRVSADFDLTRLEPFWNASKERTYDRIKVKKDPLSGYNFDFERFFQGFDRVFPPRLRTTENLKLIAELASVHGISEEDMRPYVQRSINPNTHDFNKSLLKEQVYRSRKVSLETQDPYSMAPSQFLASKQNGIPASPADKKLIDKLVNQYKLPLDVINVLIEYVLRETNQQFPAAYVEKIAATWARLNVDSREKAFEQTDSQRQKPQTQRTYTKKGKEVPPLPEWYANTAPEKPSEEKLAAALARQQARKEKEQTERN
jgi:replication initiation and membrane attachment protein